MLKIYDVCLELAPVVVGWAERIAQRDRDLARQLRRSFMSVPLNIAEGGGHDRGTRRQRYRDALGSVRETIANLELAAAVGYVEVAAEPRDQLERVKATLIKVLYC